MRGKMKGWSCHEGNIGGMANFPYKGMLALSCNLLVWNHT